MFKRSLLLLLAILIFSFTELVVRGCHAAAVVGQNLPTPRNATGLRIVDLVHPTAAFARMYDLTFEPGKIGFPVAGRRRYAPAIGLGSLLAAAALTAILAPSGRWNAAGAALLVSVSWIGVSIWADFIFVALASTVTRVKPLPDLVRFPLLVGQRQEQREHLVQLHPELAHFRVVWRRAGGRRVE